MHSHTPASAFGQVSGSSCSGSGLVDGQSESGVFIKRKIWIELPRGRNTERVAGLESFPESKKDINR